MPPQNVSQDYLEKQEKLWKKSRSYPFVRKIYKRNLHLWEYLPLYLEEQEDLKSQENFIDGIGTDLNLHNKSYSCLLCFSW